MKRGNVIAAVWGLVMAAVIGLFAIPAFAAEPPSDFNLQVTPSPLVTTVKPGVKSQEELKIRNASSGTENLKIELRSFKLDNQTGKVDLKDTVSPDVASWVSFSAPKFSVPAGQWFTQQVIFNPPKKVGFSYSFAIIISRQTNATPVQGSRVINGTLAIFSLINVNRPDAKSSLRVIEFTSSKGLYEYLPATLNVTFRNSGNTIVQPYGNIFIQRDANSKKPLATLPVNDARGYILPDSTRKMSANWNDGFATYQPIQAADGSTKSHLELEWEKFSHFRIGRYSAKLVAVYNDGHSDIPIEGVVTFWVIPWRAILLAVALIVGLWFLGRWRNKRRTEKAVKRALAAQESARKETKKEASP